MVVEGSSENVPMCGKGDENLFKKISSLKNV